MTEHLSVQRHVYVPERRLVECDVRKVGVGVFLVDVERGTVCTVVEKSEKGSTGRRAGDVSILLETRKTGETIFENVVGAMEEVRPMRESEQLVWIDGVSYKGRYPLVPRVFGDVCVVGLLGVSEGDCEFETHEVSSGGWRSLSDLAGCDNLRSGVAPFISMALEDDWVEQFRRAVLTKSAYMRSYTHIQVREYLEKRQLLPDWGAH